jgi:hypothetical protein
VRPDPGQLQAHKTRPHTGATHPWRSGPESNRRLSVLQTDALPLGYRSLAGARGIEPRLAGLEAAALPPRHTPVLLVFQLSKSKKKARRFGRAFSNPDCAWTLPAAFPPWIRGHDSATGLPSGAHEYAARPITPLVSCSGFGESQHAKLWSQRRKYNSPRPTSHTATA